MKSTNNNNDVIINNKNNINIIKNPQLCFNIRIFSDNNPISSYQSKIQRIDNCANIIVKKKNVIDGKWHKLVAKITRRHIKVLLDCKNVLDDLIKEENFGNLQLLKAGEPQNIEFSVTNTTEFIHVDMKHIIIASNVSENNFDCNSISELNYYVHSNDIDLIKKITFYYEQRDWDSSKFYRLNESFYTNIILPQSILNSITSKNFIFTCIFRCYEKFDGLIALLSMLDSITGNTINFGIISGKSLSWNIISRYRIDYEYSRGILKKDILNGEWNHILIIIESNNSTKTISFYLNHELLGVETLDGPFYCSSNLQQIILFNNITATSSSTFDIKTMDLHINVNDETLKKLKTTN